MPNPSLKEINSIDIVDFLAALGYKPRRISGPHYWYLSMLPDRFEKTPSFKVNRKLNRWYDFGIGIGGSLVDFGIRYFRCSIPEFARRFSADQLLTSVAQTDLAQIPPELPTICLVDAHPIRSASLTRYLWERRIPLSVAHRYCVEAVYGFGSKTYNAIGFRTNAGGYELRSRAHKYSIGPKCPTLITRGSGHLAVFEGFFDLLTFATLYPLRPSGFPDLLVLNSAAFLHSQIPVLHHYHTILLFLDNDATGDRCTLEALDAHPGCHDCRGLYHGYKDLNDWVCNVGKAIIPPFQDPGILPSNHANNDG
jgi:hypothetical protein